MELCKECGENEVYVRSRQLCSRCYLRARRAGEIIPNEFKKSCERFQCKTLGCKNTTTIRSKSGYCRKCARKYSWAKTTPKQRKQWHLKSCYGITPEDYDKMLAEQNNVCAICGKSEVTVDYRTNKIRNLSVDHCHETKQVRGLLCEHCNTGLGKFYHSAKLLEKAAKYLKN